MINQLFRIKPDINIVNDVCKLFGLNNIYDTTPFTKEDLLRLDTINKLNNFELLKQYYIPCKYRKYFDNVNINRCITILRQLLKLYNLKLFRTEKFINSKKLLVYNISDNGKDTKTKIVISFE